jgi:hypothetical protein
MVQSSYQLTRELFREAPHIHRATYRADPCR